MIQPKPLKKGDVVALVAPSRMVTEEEILPALEVMKAWGVEVEMGNHLYSQKGYFAGSDDERLSDLQHALDHPKIKAIFCARGGYGMSRILDSIDVSSLKKYPKWIVGFSDITALHLKLNRLQMESIHGIMPVQFEYEGIEAALKSLHMLLFEGHFTHSFASGISNSTGVAEGELVGGNLSLLADSLGTASEIDTDGKILFIEEIDEYYYKVDRMLNQLKRAGKFNDLKGLMLGQFTGLKDTTIKFGASLYDIITHHLQDSDIPIAFDLPIGHEVSNIALPCGRMVQLQVTETSVTLND